MPAGVKRSLFSLPTQLDNRTGTPEGRGLPPQSPVMLPPPTTCSTSVSTLLAMQGAAGTRCWSLPAALTGRFLPINYQSYILTSYITQWAHWFFDGGAFSWQHVVHAARFRLSFFPSHRLRLEFERRLHHFGTRKRQLQMFSSLLDISIKMTLTAGGFVDVSGVGSAVSRGVLASSPGVDKNSKVFLEQGEVPGHLQSAAEVSKPPNAPLGPKDDAATRSGVPCLHPCAAGTGSNSLAVTPKCSRVCLI